MSSYDPTNLRDDRHPLRALGMAFGQRQAMDQDYAAHAPQYGQAPLAAHLMAPQPQALGGQGFGTNPPASPLAGLAASGPQIAKGLMGLYDWARGPTKDLGAMDAKQAYLDKTMPPQQGGLY